MSESKMTAEDIKGLARALEVQLHSYSPIYLTAVTAMEIIAALRSTAPSPEGGNLAEISTEQRQHMVDRFLGWKLPTDFNPDAGISFKAAFNQNTAWPGRHEPSGTNLFDAAQAKAMVRYMIEGLPAARAEGEKLAGDWQPIESTPKDGSPIDAWFVLSPEHGARWTNVCWSPEHRVWSNGPPSQYKGGWVATHWMPPPSPPSAVTAPPAGAGGELAALADECENLAQPGPDKLLRAKACVALTNAGIILKQISEKIEGQKLWWGSADLSFSEVDELLRLAALRAAVPAQAEPFLWICIVPGEWEPENIRAWTRDPDRAAALSEQGLEMRPLYAQPRPALAVGTMILEQCAATVSGEIVDGRYRHWPEIRWGNRDKDSELVRFADALATALLALKPVEREK